MNKTNEYKWGVVSKYGTLSIEDQRLHLDRCVDIPNDRILVDSLPIIGEEIRQGDTLILTEVKCFGKTIKQTVEYLLELEDEGIHFESIQEPFFNSYSSDGKSIIKSLKVIREANKNALIKNSEGIVGSGRKKGSYQKDVEAAVLAMYKVTQNVAAIAKTLGLGSRNTVYNHLRRNGIEI